MITFEVIMIFYYENITNDRNDLAVVVVLEKVNLEEEEKNNQNFYFARVFTI